MTKHVSVQVVRQFAHAIEAVGDEAVARALQAAIEKTSLGESSLDDKLYDFGHVFKARKDEIATFNGDCYRRHLNGGGWVPVEQDLRDPEKPYVSEDVHVGPFVQIGGNAKLYGGEFVGGAFHGGRFYGGTFYGGEFYGGVYGEGSFHYGLFYDGLYVGEDSMYEGGDFEHGIFDGKFEDASKTYADRYKKYRSSADADNA